MCFLGLNKFAADRRGVPKDHDSSPLINRIAGRLLKNDETQGARILRNEAYNQYAAMTKDEAQHG